uniref:Uncharacterized protein n=1 Tax=Sinocyclocheilus anshuiensis TaxID=1608454 RepID=A0A671L8V4_9TELE
MGHQENLINSHKLCHRRAPTFLPGLSLTTLPSQAMQHDHGERQHTLHDTSPGGVIGPYHVIKRAGLKHRRWPILVILSLTTYNGDNTRSTNNTMLSHPWGSPC